MGCFLLAQVWLSITEWKHGQLDFAACEGQFSDRATAIPGLSTAIIPEHLNLSCCFHSFSTSAEALSFPRPTRQTREAEHADLIAVLCSQNHRPQSSTEQTPARLLPRDMSLTLSPEVSLHSELMSPGVG